MSNKHEAGTQEAGTQAAGSQVAGSQTASSRTGVILAAGMGTRLAGVSDQTRCKPLIPVAGVPLIHRTIRSLELAGCQRIVMVLGYGFHEMRSEILGSGPHALPVTFVYNDKYQLSNGLSLLAARPEIEGTFVLTMADHILSDEMMKKAAAHTPPEMGATLLVDYRIDSVFDLDDATKVQTDGEYILAIGKQLSEYNAIDTGVFVCTPSLIDKIDTVYREKGDASLSEGVQALSEERLMRVLDIGDAYWQDVDTPEMLAHAETMLKKETLGEKQVTRET